MYTNASDLDLLDTLVDSNYVQPKVRKPFPVAAVVSIVVAVLFVVAGYFGSQAQEDHAIKTDGCSQITVQGTDAFDRCMENWNN